MDKLAYLLGPIGCAVAMVICMALMARGGRNRPGQTAKGDTEEIAALRAEVAELKADRSQPVDG